MFSEMSHISKTRIINITWTENTNKESILKLFTILIIRENKSLFHPMCLMRIWYDELSVLMFSINFMFNNVLKHTVLCLSLIYIQGWYSVSHSHDLSSEIDDESSAHQSFFSCIGYTFNDVHLLELAVTHDSEDLGITSALRGNQRLEFLGDALLEFGLRTALWRNAPESFRAELPSVFPSLSENAALSPICEHIGLDQLAPFPPTSSLHVKSPKRNPLLDAKADRLEALVGALFLDSNNMDVIFSFIERFWFSEAAPHNFRELFTRTSEQVIREQKELGYIFKEKSFLSYALGEKETFGFLGKGLLKFVCADFLYRRFPHLPEGGLTIRINVLLAKKSLPDFPMLKARKGSVFDANALISSIYLDSNLETVTNFIIWHWMDPNKSSEVKEALQKTQHFPISKTRTIISPAITTDTAPKTLLMSLLATLNQNPIFTTYGINSGFQSSVRFDFINTICEIASTKKDAEKLAAEKGLDELAYLGLLESTIPSMLTYPAEFFTKILEIYTRKHFGNDFNYHILAKHALGSKYRLEVQGAELPSVIIEAESIDEAKYKALSVSLYTQFKNMWHTLKTAPSPITTLPEPLKLYDRICSTKLKIKDPDFTITAHSKGIEKISPLLTYEIHLQNFEKILSGQGYSKEIAELDCKLEALSYIKSNTI